MSCSIDLRLHLNPTAETGGTWAQIGNTPEFVGPLNGDNPTVDFTGRQTGTYIFEYSGGTGACANAVQVTYTHLDTGDPGTDATIELCTDEAPIVIWDELNGVVGNDATFTVTGDVLSGGYSDGGTAADVTDDTFDPSVVTAGTYTFTITSSPIVPGGSTLLPCCDDASATLTINVTASFDAGTTGTFAGC